MPMPSASPVVVDLQLTQWSTRRVEGVGGTEMRALGWNRTRNGSSAHGPAHLSRSADPGGRTSTDQRHRAGAQRHALAGGPAPGAGGPGVPGAVGGGHRDNGSTDGSAGLAPRWAERYQQIRCVDAATIDGRPAARNAGVGRPRGDLLAFCDADDVVHAGWLAGCARAPARPTWWPGSSTSGHSTDSRLPPNAGGHPPARLPPRRPRRQPRRAPGGLRGSRAGSPRSCSSARTSTCAGGSSSRDSASPSLRRRGGQAGAPRVQGGVPAGVGLRSVRPDPLPPAPARPGPDGICRGAAKSWAVAGDARFPSSSGRSRRTEWARAAGMRTRPACRLGPATGLLPLSRSGAPHRCHRRRSPARFS